MAIRVLKGGENFDTFSKQVRVYAKLHGFKTVFESDPYVEVEAYRNDRQSIMAQGVSTSMYERQLIAWVFLSQAFRSNAVQATFLQSTSPRKLGIGSRLVRHENQCPKGSVNAAALQL